MGSDIRFENKKGFTWPYLIVGFLKTKLVGKKYLVPSYGLAGRIFSLAAEEILDNSSDKTPEEKIKDVVVKFGKSRGSYVKDTVLKKKKELSLRNMLIYTDLNTKNFKDKVSIDNGDLVIKITKCDFFDCAKSCGLDDGAKYYCLYEDEAFKSAYNDSIDIDVEQKCQTGKDHCIVRYKVKGRILP